MDAEHQGGEQPGAPAQLGVGMEQKRRYDAYEQGAGRAAGSNEQIE